MIHFPILRWGSPYKSLELNQVVHFDTGEPVAEVSQANPGLVARDMRKAGRARDVLREVPIPDLVSMVQKAGQALLRRPSCHLATAPRRQTTSCASSRRRPAFRSRCVG